MKILIFLIALTFGQVCCSKLQSNTRVLRKQLSIPSIALATFLSTSQISSAVPLGDHTGCAYPACTSQVEILQSTAPGLVSNYVKEQQIQSLKDISFTLKEFSKYVENKDYASIRVGLRSQPASTLRLTARKVRNYIDKPLLNDYIQSYDKMIATVDDVDSLANLRLRDASNDKELTQAIEKAIITYSAFLETIDRVVVLTPTPAESTTTTTTTTTTTNDTVFSPSSSSS